MRRTDMKDALNTLKESFKNGKKLVDCSDHLFNNDPGAMDMEGFVEDLDGRIDSLKACVELVHKAYGEKEDPSFDFDGENPSGPDVAEPVEETEEAVA